MVLFSNIHLLFFTPCLEWKVNVTHRADLPMRLSGGYIVRENQNKKKTPKRMRDGTEKRNPVCHPYLGM